MACILLKQEDIANSKKAKVFEELRTDDPNDIDSGHWKAKDALSEVEQNVMYYAYDVKRVLSQAKAGKGIPIFLKIQKGGEISTVLALKKSKPRKGESPYYDYAAAGWPSRYESVKTMYGPGHTVDYDKKGSSFEIDEV